MATARRRRKIRRRRRWEGWRRHGILYICIIASALLHLSLLVSVSPWWLGKAPRVRPREVKPVSLKLKPRAAPPRPPVKAPPRPEVARPVKKIPVPAPVYTERELEKKLARVRSKEAPAKFAKPKAVRARDVMEKKQNEIRSWVEREKDVLEERIDREEAGEVGYSRIVDLKESSDYQVVRLMEQFDMDIGYGSRKIADLNVQFISEWLFTPGQVRNLISRRRSARYREIADAIPGGTTVVALRESGEGPPRSYISPTVDAIAAIVAAEEKYFAETGADPDEMERLVFGPVWTYRGPTFEIVRAEKKEQAKEPPDADKKNTEKTANNQ